LPAKGVEAETKRAASRGAVSEGRVVLDVHILRLDELLVREVVLRFLKTNKSLSLGVFTL